MARKEILTPVDGNDPRIGLTSEGELVVPAAGIRTASGDPVAFASGTAETDPFAGGDNDIASAAALRTLALMVQQLIEIVQQGGGGGGGGPIIEVNTPPTLPDTATFSIPEGLPDGAIVGYVTPLVVGSPAPGYTITPVTGLAVREDTGDIYIDDAVALYAALETEVDDDGNPSAEETELTTTSDVGQYRRHQRRARQLRHHVHAA